MSIRTLAADSATAAPSQSPVQFRHVDAMLPSAPAARAVLVVGSELSAHAGLQEILRQHHIATPHVVAPNAAAASVLLARLEPAVVVADPRTLYACPTGVVLARELSLRASAGTTRLVWAQLDAPSAAAASPAAGPQ